MGTVLVCVPARRGDPDALWQAPLQAFTANRALLEALDYDVSMDEEAERAALVLASVWGLIHFGERLVVTAEVDEAQLGPGEETGNGGVSLVGLGAAQLIAFFTDPDENPSAAAAAVAGLSLDEAWSHPEVEALLANDLQWHDLGEWSL